MELYDVGNDVVSSVFDILGVCSMMFAVDVIPVVEVVVN